MLSTTLTLFILLGASNISAKPLAENKTCGYDACPKTDPNKFNVHLVCHSHDDLGWLNTVDGYLNQYMVDIFKTVVEELLKNSSRKFVQTESAYLSYWWKQQTEEEKDKFRHLVNNGQIEIVNGAWCSNDEAATHYQSIIDQFTLGHRFLEDEFGECARTNIGWQVDTFGHSREQASLYAQMGIDGFLFARFHFEDLAKRKENRTMDLLWIGSENLGVQESNIFTSMIYNHYSHPAGFCFDANCGDPEIIDDENDEGYNVEERVIAFADYVREQATHYTSNNILVTMGDDFQYTVASKNFGNIDKLIAGFEKFQPTMDDGTPISILYSSPSCYTKSVNDYMIRTNGKLDVKYDDFFPHAHSVHEYWAGFFTSRPTSKRFERIGNNVLQIARQLSGFANLAYNVNYDLEDAIGVMQHHDAITGTEREAVEQDYHRLIANGISKSVDNIEESLRKILNDDSLQLAYCPLANISICAETKKDEFNIVLYNPLGRTVKQHVQVPVEGNSWTITDPEGNVVQHFMTKPIREFNEAAEDLNAALNSDLVIFDAEIPPLGLSVYNFKKQQSARFSEVDHFIKQRGNKLRIGFDDNNVIIGEDNLINQITVQGNTVNVKQEFLYYISNYEVSNPYLFRPDEEIRTAQVLSDDVKVTYRKPQNGVMEIKQVVNDWVTQIIRIFEGDNHIELDWAVGPIDVSNGKGREVISRFTTDWDTKGVFYTDSNSREILRRENQKRPTYEYTNEEPQSGNYFPVTSRVYLENETESTQFAIITDRAEGAASLESGQLELMIHRVTLNAYSSSVNEPLNEIEYGIGVIARGTHYITIGKSSSSGDKSVAEFAQVTQRKLAQQVHLSPITLISSGHLKTTTTSLLNGQLPENVHILTFGKWNDIQNTYILRLEHFYEVDDDPVLSQEVIVDLENLLSSLKVESIEEKVLTGIKPIEKSVRLSWPQLSEVNKLKKKIGDDGLKISLAPMQIRTFILTVNKE